MNLQAKASGPIEEGFDRQNLNIIHKRFMAINEKRLERMRGALTHRQLLILDTLPLLFHTNHPMMPGYVSHQTPAHLSNYKPSKKDVLRGKTVARSFRLSQDTTRDPDIYGIYVMGSVGTVAQSERSDLDIWICYRPGISASSIHELGLKCERISEWAQNMRLEIHFFLMDYEAFKRGQIAALNEESSGSAQKLLLLDEFYRTAIYLAGRLPLWWFVPHTSEPNYERHTQTLLHKRFLRSSQVLDFGGIPTIPHGEFFGAGVWQLYKAIESPYKSVLKLLLLEAYVSDYPNIRPLSLTFKKQVYRGEVDADELDSYVMIYRRIEKYLKSQKQKKRLELARRCFYFKVNKPLTKPPSGRTKSWQRKLLERLTLEWGWDYDQLLMMDKRLSWKAPHVALERSLIVNELNHCYRFLLDFANTTGVARAISTEEVTVLGRKLQAAFERKPGKIEWINPGISNDLSEEFLSISEVFDEQSKALVWTAFSQNMEDDSGGTAIKSSISLVELMLWCYFNGVVNAHTHIELQQAPSLKITEVRKLISVFQNWLPIPLEAPSHQQFQQSAKPTEALILINVGKSPAPHLEERGYQRLSNNVDALRYSSLEENLVVSVDLITRNNWDEINTRRFDRANALLDALKEYLCLCLPGTHQTPPQLSIECIGSSHATTIKTRVEKWFNEITECYYNSNRPPCSRYLFELSDSIYSLQFIGAKPEIKRHTSETLLVNYLSAEQNKYSPLVVDSNALSKHPIKCIAANSKSNAINIFYRRFDIGMELYTLDEKGSVYHTVLRGHKEIAPLKPLHRFLRSVIIRQQRINPELTANFGIYPIHFHELVEDHHQEFLSVSKRVSTEIQQLSVFEVQAVSHLDANDNILFDFYCDDQEFSALSFGEQLYTVVAQFILARRTSSTNEYPIYITDLDLSLCSKIIAEDGELQIIHYLKTKNWLETKLNEAIGLLTNAN